ncbi:hypothetical protein [Isoptericola sp. BMS4]|uniref:hypothetical protein n=1 Tax=Isoptericola sp. BMS4 TaxID=2527875 RepID=UPI0014236A75|nr:hypothetical protein [Isoptericola sp. BMS4]
MTPASLALGAVAGAACYGLAFLLSPRHWYVLTRFVALMGVAGLALVIERLVPGTGFTEVWLGAFVTVLVCQPVSWAHRGRHDPLLAGSGFWHNVGRLMVDDRLGRSLVRSEHGRPRSADARRAGQERS